MSCLEIKDLTVRFRMPGGALTAVDQVSLSFCGSHPSAVEHDVPVGATRDSSGPYGRSLALVGETGCGKSVLAHAVLRLLPQNAEVSGQVLFGGQDLLALSERELSRLRGDRIAIVPQNPSLSLNPVLSIGRQITEVYAIHRGERRGDSSGKAAYLLQKLGFDDAGRRLSMYPSQFSEGMNQRVLIAASVALEPRILLADEPTKGLDQDLKKEVIRELKLVTGSWDTALFLITHDLEAARTLCQSIAVMYSGEIIEQADTGSFFREPLHPYTQALRQSLPENGFQPIAGISPTLSEPPSGCRFHPRCSRVMEICKNRRPELLNHSGRAVRCYLYR
jgi:peptide/nickel transport system ATP-binding protein